MQRQPPPAKYQYDKEELGHDEFVVAYEVYGPGIYRFLYWRTGDRMTSEDLMTGAFVHAWESRRSFHGGSVQAWLYRITRNLLIDYWRKNHDIPVADADGIAESVEDSSAAMDAELSSQRLHTAISGLPRTMQQVIELRFIEHNSARQVANRLHMTEANVRVTQFRALQLLRERL